MELSEKAYGDYTILTIRGKLDWEGAEALDKELARHIDRGCLGIALVLDEVSFICSGGIGAMVANLNKIKRNRGELYIVTSSEYVNTMFEDLRFGLVLSGRLFGTFEQFSGSLRRGGGQGKA